MTAPNRRPEPGRADALLLPAAATILTGLGILWSAVTLGSALDHANPHLPRDPFGIAIGLARGTTSWPAASTWITSVLLLAVAASAALLWRHYGRRPQRIVDRAGRYMATGPQLRQLHRRQAIATSRRLGVPASAGIPLGRLVATRQPLFASFEDMVTVVAGPRVGKSTALVIPAITAAPGAVVTTSNKRDVLDATRDLRADTGPVWVFDPQAVAHEQASWWWNPLSYVTDDTRAAKLARLFAAGSRTPDARTDAFFDTAGQNLLAALLLAAALGQRPIRDVHGWLTDPTEEDPVRLLRDNGSPMTADAVLGVIQSTDKLRGSIYATAQEMAGCLHNSHVTDWVNPHGPDDPRPQFDPDRFVAGAGTLYSLSKEGAGTAGPLVAALTAATLEAATDLAETSPGGRLPVPLLAILDEAANVCRWPDLPDLYSHFGSRGIPIISVFQSWSQGVAVFGREGMLKLWSASNAFLYMGGVRETDFLTNLADLIGHYDHRTVTASHGRHGRSTSIALRRERILGVDDLAALPRGRAILLTTGSRAALLATTPWYGGPRHLRMQIAASIAAHDPGTRRPSSDRAAG